jgi:phenylalanyl-tRNA synthetase beta chain
VVDASNLVMLELGQPTHPYDAASVAGHTLRARRARQGEVLTTLDGVERQLAKPVRGLGDTGEDCVIVDGDDTVLGLAGIMGGASSEISATTSEVLLEAAFFDPMTIARSSKRHGLRSEASNRFERGVDPQLALYAAARYVEILRESVPDLEWLSNPLDVEGVLPTIPEVELRADDIERMLGLKLEDVEVTQILEGLGFDVRSSAMSILVAPPSSRLDIRSGAAGRADVIEEIARLYSYRRLPRRTPSWPEPGGLSTRQRLRRRVRDVIVDLGVIEVWTPTLGSDADFDLVHPQAQRVRVTNPLASDESVLRATIITGLLRAWSRNLERGLGDIVLGELGIVFAHPSSAPGPRMTKGGDGGTLSLELPRESERLTIVFARKDDDATSAVAFWALLADRLGLSDVVVRSDVVAPPALHPTRSASLIDRKSGSLLGHVGEIDDALLRRVAPALRSRRVGVLDLDFDTIADESRVLRRSQMVELPSRFPSAVIDLAFVTPNSVHAQDLAHALRTASELVEDVELFDVYFDSTLPEATRSLAYSVRFSSVERTLAESEVASAREQLIATGETLGAVLR